MWFGRLASVVWAGRIGGGGRAAELTKRDRNRSQAQAGMPGPVASFTLDMTMAQLLTP